MAINGLPGSAGVAEQVLLGKKAHSIAGEPANDVVWIRLQVGRDPFLELLRGDRVDRHGDVG
jgi:hypothetical protein